MNSATAVRRLISATTLTGTKIRNSAGEDLGRIEDLVLDAGSGRIGYAVLSFGGFLGLGDKRFAIPWAPLKVEREQKTFRLDVERSVLEGAPGFDRDHRPDMADIDWGSRIHSYYGYRPYWE